MADDKKKKDLTEEETQELKEYLEKYGYETAETKRKMNQLDSYLYLPVHAQSWSFLFKSIPKRILGFVSKAISIKVAMFATATYLFWVHPQEFGWWAWTIVFIVTAFGRDAGKILKHFDKSSSSSPSSPKGM